MTDEIRYLSFGRSLVPVRLTGAERDGLIEVEDVATGRRGWVRPERLGRCTGGVCALGD